MELVDIPTIDALKYLYEPREERSEDAIWQRLLLLSSVSSEAIPNTMAFGSSKAIALDPDGWRFIVYIHSFNHTHTLVVQTGVFTLSVPPRHMLEKVRNCGSVSGKDCNKFEQFGLAPLSSRIVDAPIVDGCAMFLECKVIRFYPLVSIELQDDYQGGTKIAFETDIVASYGQQGYEDMLAL